MTNCELCGEPMPEGEEMFKYHGSSGPCPKTPIKATAPLDRPWMMYFTANDQQRLRGKVLEYLDRENVFGDHFSEHEIHQITTLLGRPWEEKA